MVRKALLLLPLLLVACAPIEEDAAEDGAEALSQSAGAGTVLTGASSTSADVEVGFRIEGVGKKRTARALFQRGDASADLECSQEAIIEIDPRSDGVWTRCGDQAGKGDVTIQFSYSPSLKRFTANALAKEPAKLTTRQRELYRLLAGKEVNVAPLPKGEARLTDGLSLSFRTKTLGTDPLADPMALANAVHAGLRAPLGVTAIDRRGAQSSSDASYTIERVRASTNYASLDCTLELSGPEKRTDVEQWHFNQPIKVSLLAAPNKLASEAEVRAAVLARIREL